MIDQEYYREFLRIHLNAKPASGGREMTCRCKYCPDGKSKTSSHMYISIPMDDNTPSLYNCVLCHSHGLITQDTLMEWGIFEPEMAAMIIRHNKGLSIQGSKYKGTGRSIRYIDNYVYDEKLALYKLSYINQRLGLSMTIEDAKRLKIILNIKDVIHSNSLELTRDRRIVDELNNYFMGFLSLDNSIVNMRRMIKQGHVNKTIDKRYVNYKLYNANNNIERFYTIPTNIDMNSPYRIPIHIAEGPFDILGIYYHLRHCDPFGIYSSICGSNYMSIITHLIHTFKLPYIELHLYPDNDKYGSHYVLENIKGQLRYLQCPIYIHRNIAPNEKDFGVTSDRIYETINRIQ